jgi:hypothetical protein
VQVSVTGFGVPLAAVDVAPHEPDCGGVVAGGVVAGGVVGLVGGVPVVYSAGVYGCPQVDPQAAGSAKL